MPRCNERERDQAGCDGIAEVAKPQNQQFLHQIQAYSPAMDDSDALVGKRVRSFKGSR